MPTPTLKRKRNEYSEQVRCYNYRRKNYNIFLVILAMVTSIVSYSIPLHGNVFDCHYIVSELSIAQVVGLVLFSCTFIFVYIGLICIFISVYVTKIE